AEDLECLTVFLAGLLTVLTTFFVLARLLGARFLTGRFAVLDAFFTTERFALAVFLVAVLLLRTDWRAVPFG
ncbi:MAG: hypothetical protein PVJ88_04980, partial [Desulfobacterales bacterium]